MKRKPIRLNRKQRLDELKTFVAICFSCVGENAHDVAKATGLSLSTVYRLLSGEISLAVHYGTIQALGLAAGLRLEIEGNSYRVSLAKRAA